MSDTNDPRADQPMYNEPQAEGAMPPPTDAGQIGGDPTVVDPMIRTLLLVSAIANAVFAVLNILAGLMTCVNVFIAPAFIVLAVFEFLLWNDLGKPGDHRSKAGKLQIIAICQIVTILGCNVVSLVCGIMQLVNKNKLDAPAGPPAGITE